MRTGLVTIAGGLLIAGATITARAQDLDKPLLLVASPGTSGFYSRSVLIAVPNGDQHVGFMINRATRTTVASAFPNEPHSARVAEPIYLGGPSGAQSLYAVARRDPGEGSRRLFGDGYDPRSWHWLNMALHAAASTGLFFVGSMLIGAGRLSPLPRVTAATGDWLALAAAGLFAIVRGLLG